MFKAPISMFIALYQIRTHLFNKAPTIYFTFILPTFILIRVKVLILGWMFISY